MSMIPFFSTTQCLALMSLLSIVKPLGAHEPTESIAFTTVAEIQNTASKLEVKAVAPLGVVDVGSNYFSGSSSWAWNVCLDECDGNGFADYLSFFGTATHITAPSGSLTVCFFADIDAFGAPDGVTTLNLTDELDSHGDHVDQFVASITYTILNEQITSYTFCLDGDVLTSIPAAPTVACNGFQINTRVLTQTIPPFPQYPKLGQTFQDTLDCTGSPSGLAFFVFSFVPKVSFVLQGGELLVSLTPGTNVLMASPHSGGLVNSALIAIPVDHLLLNRTIITQGFCGNGGAPVPPGQTKLSNALVATIGL